ncbi:MAG: response regulator [Bacillota bacterium]
MVKKILIADADPSRRNLLRATLQDPRYEIIEASGGVQALALREKHKPDLVIVDESVPGLSGVEVCRAIKQGMGGSTPVILLTERETPPEVGEAGPDVFLPKPYSPLRLLGAVEKLLGQVGD